MNSRQRQRLRISVLAILATAAVLMPSRAESGGAPTCTYDEGTQTVTATAHPSFSQVAISRDGDEIEASGVDCGAATRFNTDTIVVNDVQSHALSAFVTLNDGPMRPGATNEPGSSDEIELEFNLGTEPDTFIARGSRNMRAGTAFVGGFNFEHRVNLNAGESTGIDYDVVVKSADETFSLQGTEGDDMLKATGGAGTSGTLLINVNLVGGTGPGKDLLVGGAAGDLLLGQAGADTIRGGNGNDRLRGDKGGDVLRGNADQDDLDGGPGDDYLNGGAGSDSCDPGTGTNTVTKCE